MGNTAGEGVVTLRDVTESDLEVFFEQQREPQGAWMAGLTASDPDNHAEYLRMWAMIRSFAGTTMRTVLYNGAVAGDVLSHLGAPERPEVGYWLGKEYWGKGVATRALNLFLAEMTVRPAYARVLKDNAASLRVLEKCGFRITGDLKEYANVRGAEVELYHLTLR